LVLALALLIPANAAAKDLSAFGSSSTRIVLVPRRDRLAFSVEGSAWLRFTGGKLENDPATGGSLKSLAAKFEGDSVLYGWGRTPLVASDDPKKPRLARAGSTRPVTVPGVIQTVVALSETSEVWSYAAGMSHQLVIVDAKDRLKHVPWLPVLGPAVPGVMAGLCDRPTVWRLVPAPDGVAAIFVECHRDAPLRRLTIRPDGTTHAQTLDPLGPLDVEPNDVVIGPDGTTLIAGRSRGKLVVARAGPDGHWSLTKTTIPNIEAQGIVVSDGAVWTLCLGQGGDGKDVWTLARDGVPVEVRDPSGKVLLPRGLGFDSDLGVVVRAFDRTGSFEYTTWLLAEHAPPGPVRELP
jgi:hypothetical protein